MFDLPQASSQPSKNVQKHNDNFQICNNFDFHSESSSFVG